MTKTNWNSSLTPVLGFLLLAMVAALFTTSCSSMKQRAAERKAALNAASSKEDDKKVEKTHSKPEVSPGIKTQEPDPLPSDVTEISAPVPDSDPEKAYFCEFQALITKFEAYGSTQADATAKVKALCVKKFGPSHCVDEEDLRCRKTFY